MAVPTSRRRFLVGTFASALVCEAATSMAGAGEPVGLPAIHECLDYGRSFVAHAGPGNAVRLWIESRTSVIDESTGATRHYYQCGSCKSEATFAEKNLFSTENYDFLPIIGREQLMLFRRHAALNADYRDIRTRVAGWGEPRFLLRAADRVTLLDTWPKIQSAIENGAPIVARTTISDSSTRLRAVVEYPVKTMNMHVERRLWQLDTGPIALPDISQRYEQPIDALRLAFVACNRPDRADFVVEQPTPVVVEGRKITEVRHYSGPFSLPAENVLLALGEV